MGTIQSHLELIPIRCWRDIGYGHHAWQQDLPDDPRVRVYIQVNRLDVPANFV